MRRILLPLVVLAVAAPAVPAASAAAPADWRTFGFSPSRASINPTEHGLGPAAARSTSKLWSADLGGVVEAQPVVAFGVTLPSGKTADVVYVGTEAGAFYALDARTGAVIWSRELGALHISECYTTKGITSTAVIDRGRGSVYVVDGLGRAYELNVATGATKHRWTITKDPQHEYVWSALTLVNGRLYIPVSGICDIPPYHGRVVAIDVATRKRVAAWYVTGRHGPDGGGIWAWGGVSADPAKDAIFAATGNSLPAPHEKKGLSERVVRLTGNLKVRASDEPGVKGFDADFGATPLLYRAPGCPRQLAVGNKYGGFFVYDRDHIGRGPVQRIELGGSGDGGHALLGVAAWWKAKRLVYVSNPLPRGSYKRGIVALRVTDGCRLKRVWQAKGPGDLTSSPTLADGVLWYGTGKDSRLLAIDASTGKKLWGSGKTIGDPIFNAPAVAGGAVFVGAFDGNLYAFGPGP